MGSLFRSTSDRDMRRGDAETERRGVTFGYPSRWRLWALGLLTAVTLGCASGDTEPPTPVAPDPTVTQDIEIRALLLLLTDRLTYDPITFSRALNEGPAVRRQLAYTMARIGDRRGGAVLEGLLGDPDAGVRRVAAFALGELGETTYPQGARALLGAVHDTDLETGRLAVEALAKIGVRLEDIIPRLSQAPSEEILARLMPSLYRFRGPAVLRWSAQGRESSDPRVRAMAAYGIARNAQPEAASALRELLDDDDPWVRGWGARGLGQVGERADLERLRPLLDDAEPGPIIQALRAGRRLVDDAKAAPSSDWQPRLLELLKDPRPGVRLSAIETSAAWLLDEALSAELLRLASEGQRREQELAMLALAEGGDPNGLVLALRNMTSGKPSMRRRAAEALAFSGQLEHLQRLEDDADPGVRRTVLDMRLLAVEDPEQARPWVEAALQDTDPAVRAGALGWLVDFPIIDLDTLLESLARSRRDRLVDARLAAVRVLGSVAESKALERGGALVALEELAEDDELLVRREAIRALTRLGQDAPKLGTVESRKPVQVYRDIAQRTSKPRQVRIETQRGAVVVRLACPEAPLTCLNFLQLASQGFYDGLEMHRVVPDFVVQGGDPRGDGSGGPGYTVRDEINLLRYDRGVVGMALSGPDTGGSQFFVTLSSQPHLDGGYTAFGRVVQGFEVLPRILQGDTILSIREANSL